MSRQTPRAFELMPEILEMLKRDGKSTRAAIRTLAKRIIERHNYTERSQAIGWVLTMLKWKGFAANPKHGIWVVTTIGRSTTLDENAAHNITLEYERSMREGRTKKRDYYGERMKPAPAPNVP
jgi:hypothetical protein